MLNIKFIDQLLHVVYLLQIVTYSGLAEFLQCQEKAPSNTVEYIKTLIMLKNACKSSSKYTVSQKKCRFLEKRP